MVALQSLMSACSFWSNKSRQKLEGRDAMVGEHSVIGLYWMVLDGIGWYWMVLDGIGIGTLLDLCPGCGNALRSIASMKPSSACTDNPWYQFGVQNWTDFG